MLLALVVSGACGNEAPRRGRTVLFASGADLQSINPLLTTHPLARQVQRYVLLMTLARYDSALVPHPYLARAWHWSADGRALTFALRRDVRWHDGAATTARDVVWTLDAARDPVTGYPRLSDLRALESARALNDSTVELRFGARFAANAFPDVLTDLSILPAHLLDSVPRARLREAAWNEHPIGNGPFRFVLRDPALAIREYPVIFPYGLVFNTRRAPFDDPRIRRAAALAINRREIIDGYLFGYAAPADGPVPPGLPQYVPAPPVPFAPDSARRLLQSSGTVRPRFEILSVGSGEGALEQMLQAQLAAVGFDVSIRQLELSAFLDRVTGPRHDFAAAVMGIPGDPALGFLQTVGELTGLPVSADPAAAQRFLAEQLPVVWLYHARGVQGVNQRVHGVRMDMRGELPTVAAWRVDK